MVDLEGIVVAILSRPVDHNMRFHVLSDIGGAFAQIQRILSQFRIGIGELPEFELGVHPQMRTKLHDFHAQVVGQHLQINITVIGDLGRVVHLQTTDAFDGSRQSKTIGDAQVGTIALFDETITDRTQKPDAAGYLDVLH